MARAEDLQAIEQLALVAPTAAQWPAAEYERAIGAQSERRLLVLAEDGDVHGFAMAKNVGAEWEMENIVIADSARRNGFGGRLLRELLREAHDAGAKQVWLEVRESNVPARGLYRKSGFQEAGRRKRYYRDPQEDALLYKLTLPAG